MNRPQLKMQKSQYSEQEAAQQLGISIERLRTLIRHHIAQSDEEVAQVPMTTFQPSDLLLLRFLSANSSVEATAAH